MNKETRNTFLSIAEIILVYLVVIGIPFGLFIKNETVLYIISIVLRAAFFPIALIFIHKNNLERIPKLSFKIGDFLFIPFLVLTISNFIVCMISKCELSIPDNLTIVIIKSAVFSILTALNEELLFRVVLHSEILKYKSIFISILISSAIFGSIHLFNISSLGSIPSVLLQVVYSFGTGLVLSLIYTFTKNYLYIVSFHFLFNFLNGDLIDTIYIVEYNYIYFLVNIGLALLLAGYGVLIYLLKVKEDNNVSEPMDI